MTGPSSGGLRSVVFCRWKRFWGELAKGLPSIGETHVFLGGGLKDFLMFTPKIGEDEPNLTSIVQMG